MDRQAIRINCAGPELKDSHGQVWQSSEAAPMERVHGAAIPRELSLPVYDRDCPDLYRSGFFSEPELRINCENARYRLRCYFAETADIAGSMHGRCFDVVANGEKIFRDINPYHDGAGYGRPFCLSADIEIANDGLNLACRGINPFINAIELIPNPTAACPAKEGLGYAPENHGHYGLDIPPHPHDKQLRSLWIGNSGSFFWDIPNSVRCMLDSWGSHTRIDVDTSFSGGKVLKWHWHESDVCERIRQGNYDLVILQEGTAAAMQESGMSDSAEYSKRFCELCREHGAGPIYYSSYLHEKFSQEERRHFGDQFAQIARDLDMPAVIGSEIMQHIIDLYPELQTHSCDTVHQAMHPAYAMAIGLASIIAEREAKDHPAPAILGDLVPISAKNARKMEHCCRLSAQRYSPGS